MQSHLRFLLFTFPFSLFCDWIYFISNFLSFSHLRFVYVSNSITIVTQILAHIWDLHGVAVEVKKVGEMSLQHHVGLGMSLLN